MGVVISLIAIYEYFTQNDVLAIHEGRLQQEEVMRANGPFGSAETLGIVLSCIFFLVLTKYVLSNKNRSMLFKGTHFVALVLISVGVFSCLFRGIWLAFFIALTVQFLLRGNSGALKTVSIFFLAVLLIVFLAYGQNPVANTDIYEKRISQTTTMYSRIGAWVGGTKMFLDSPLWGVGFGNFQEEFEDKYMNIKINDVPAVPRPHNTFISVLAETGILGTIPFLLLMGNIAFMSIRYTKNQSDIMDREWALVCLSVLMVYFISSLTLNFTMNNDLRNKFFFIIVGMMAGRVIRCCREESTVVL